MNYHIALIVGRFQPFHKGHLFLIKKALEKADKIIVAIGSSNITDVNNPIDFETRKKIIKAVFYKEGIEEKLSKIVPLDDFFDDKKWFINLKKQVGKFDIALGNNDWTNNILEKAGYKVLKVDYYKRGMYEGWRVRALIREGKKWQDRVPKYIVSWLHGFIAENNGTMKQLNNVVLGGTFDHFHKGHKALLTKALEVGKKVTVGIATEKLYKNKFLSETIESFEIRKQSVKKFIKNYLMNDRSGDIISFSDIYGTTLKESNIDAIIVSRETFPNALKINEERKKIHFKPLQVVIVEDVLAEDEKLISSERIRTGEIDREGHNFQFSIFNFQKKEILMPESLRPILQKPLGRVFKEVHKVIKFIKFIKPTMVIAVGDIITDSLLKEGIDPDVKVIDFKTRRKEFLISNFKFLIKSKISNIKFQNKPGTINIKTAERLRELIRDSVRRGSMNSWLVVDGEEDLLTLPAILFAPLNSLVLYGHWQHGIITVEVDEVIKDKVREIIKKFN
ncbi:MAG: pantetheine-phosphate adenylyltransferase [Patescibacteria group bacterium]